MRSVTLRTILSSLITAALLWEASPAQSPKSQTDDPRAWVKRGVVTATNMEALSFVLRRGGQLADFADRWHRAMSESEVLSLQASGVNLVLVTLMKGAGLKAEADDIRAARTFVEAAHRHGLKVGGYVGASIFYEQMFADVPESKNWMQRDEFGRPIFYNPAQTFRYMACRNNPGYIAYIHQVLRHGIVDLKMDMVHFDQMMWRDAPASCHCDACQRLFREFVKERYPPASAKLRFGYADLGAFTIPAFGIEAPPIRLPELRNPLMQEWARFRAWSLARSYRELCDYVHQLNPAVAVEANPSMYPEANAGFMWGVDLQQLLESGDIVCSEEDKYPAWTADGRLVTMIRTYKEVRTMKTPLCMWQIPPRMHGAFPGYEGDEELGLAEALAFNDRNLGIIAGLDTGVSSVPPMVKKYVDFFYGQPADRETAVPIADAAVLRSFASNEFNPAESLVSTVLFEQALIQGKVPFAIVFDKQLQQDLVPYKVLVLANQDALGDDQIEAIRRFVSNGGGLVATEATSTLTAWRLGRGKFGLADLFGIDRPEQAKGMPVRRAFGKGRVVYLPRIVRTVEPPPPTMNYFFRPAYWKLPANYPVLLDAVRWAAGGRFSAEIQAPLWVTCELAQQPDTGLLLHLVNYRPAEPVRDIRVQLRVPAGYRASGATLASPDSTAKTPLPVHSSADSVTFVVPKLRVYDLIAVKLDRL